MKGFQAQVLKIKEIETGELFAGKFYLSSDPELIQKVFFPMIQIKKFLINFFKKNR